MYLFVQEWWIKMAHGASYVQPLLGIENGLLTGTKGMRQPLGDPKILFYFTRTPSKAIPPGDLIYGGGNSLQVPVVPIFYVSISGDRGGQI